METPHLKVAGFNWSDEQVCFVCNTHYIEYLVFKYLIACVGLLNTYRVQCCLHTLENALFYTPRVICCFTIYRVKELYQFTTIYTDKGKCSRQMS